MEPTQPKPVMERKISGNKPSEMVWILKEETMGDNTQGPDQHPAKHEWHS